MTDTTEDEATPVTPDPFDGRPPTDYKSYIMLLPKHMQDGMLRWIEHGIAPGSFLTHILVGELFNAYQAADPINKSEFQSYCEYLLNYAPSACFGSWNRVSKWNKQGGLNGLVRKKS